MALQALLCERERERLLSLHDDCQVVGCYPFEKHYLNDVNYDTDLVLVSTIKKSMSDMVSIEGIEVFVLHIIQASIIEEDCLETIPNKNGVVYKLPINMLNSTDSVLRAEYRNLAFKMFPYLSKKIALKIDGELYNCEKLLFYTKYNKKLDSDKDWELCESPFIEPNEICDFVIAVSTGMIATAAMIKSFRNCSASEAWELTTKVFGGKKEYINPSSELKLFDLNYIVDVYKSHCV